MVHHARAQEGGKSLAFLRRAVPNYSTADLPEEMREFRYPPQR
jgi:hypothetical protein